MMIKNNQRLPLLLLLLVLIFSSAGIPVWSQKLSAVRTSDGIEISEGSKKILFYQIKPKSHDGKYERANYIHPLYSLRGSVLTEDFPADHPHHHGIFWSWHQIVYNGKPIGDGWTSEGISWEVVDADIASRERSVVLDADVLWRSAKTGDDEEIVREQTSIIVYAANSHYRILDFNIHLAALKDNLKIGGSDDVKGYGGFSFRLKLPGDIRFINDRGEVEAQILSVDAGPWLDFVGSFDGDGKAKSGVAVFSHPSNPGHPQQWILRSQKSMQNIAFPGRTPVELTREGIRLRYRMVLHEQDVSLEDLDRLYRVYSEL